MKILSSIFCTPVLTVLLWDDCHSFLNCFEIVNQQRLIEERTTQKVKSKNLLSSYISFPLFYLFFQRSSLFQEIKLSLTQLIKSKTGATAWIPPSNQPLVIYQQVSLILSVKYTQKPFISLHFNAPCQDLSHSPSPTL